MNLEDSYYIDPTQKDRGMISFTCKHHPTLRWETKNIAPLGCRRIFFSSNEDECNCPASDLIIIPNVLILSEYVP